MAHHSLIRPGFLQRGISVGHTRLSIDVEVEDLSSLTQEQEAKAHKHTRNSRMLVKIQQSRPLSRALWSFACASSSVVSSTIFCSCRSGGERYITCLPASRRSHPDLPMLCGPAFLKTGF